MRFRWMGGGDDVDSHHRKQVVFANECCGTVETWIFFYRFVVIVDWPVVLPVSDRHLVGTHPYDGSVSFV